MDVSEQGERVLFSSKVLPPLFIQGLRYTNQADFSSQIHATLRLGFRILLVKFGFRVL
jgi:hypothetical protein